MARMVSADGVSLYVEESGRGHPILFIHEFAGNQRSWMRQVDHFSRGFRCITFSARGYPPSDVPTELANYSQDRAVSDAIDVLDALSVEQAHVVGLSMGGFCALHLGLRHPHRVTALVVASVGYGAHPDRQATFREECEDMAATILANGLPEFAQRYALGPARIPLRIKDPLGWAEFVSVLAGNSGVGMAMTMRGVQKARPSLYDLTAELRQLTIPTLLLVGEEDPESIAPSAMLQQTLPSATLSLLPATGHTLNLEDPDVFNALVEEFLTAVARPASA
jgi:pimeloyl-ACP methyl ester carboxylesterase